jgi:cysteine sulfinate desulfinase/cysteine desulfurase-like protein
MYHTYLEPDHSYLSQITGSGSLNHAYLEQLCVMITQEGETRGAALVIPAMVAVDKAVRDASTNAEKRLDELHVEMSMRKDVFDNVSAFRCV